METVLIYKNNESPARPPLESRECEDMKNAFRPHSPSSPNRYKNTLILFFFDTMIELATTHMQNHFREVMNTSAENKIGRTTTPS